jgi:hypothetical protein
MTLKKTGHKVAEYNATDNIVVCTCGNFTGTAEEFHPHRFSTLGGRRKYSALGTLDFLKDMEKARFSYYLQGSTGLYRPREDASNGYKE